MFSQNFDRFKENEKKHLIGLELGMFHRGLIGTSYNYMFVKSGNFLVQSGVGAGIGGLPFGGGINQFYFCTGNVGFGNFNFLKDFYITAGCDFHHAMLRIGTYDEVEMKWVAIEVNGQIIAPFLGLYGGSENIYFEMRLSPLYWAKKLNYDEVLGGVGVTAYFPI